MYIRVQTAQYVPIEYEAASTGERIAAFLLDAALMFAYVFTANELFSGISEPGVYLMFVVFPVVVYPLAWEMFFNGQTPGKAALKIRVVKLDGSSPSFGAYMMRWILGWLENWIFFGIPSLVATTFSGRGQRLGDMAAGTAVIRLNYKVKFEHTLFRESDEDYRPRYPSAAMLSDKDVAIVNELLRSREGALKERLLAKAARRLEVLLGVEAQEPRPYDFLNRLLLDYNHLAGRDGE
ncbi:MAG: RDD family protein [Bacteroidia bacterium]|nr:RDD family protein [Bacteroidia bacterium]